MPNIGTALLDRLLGQTQGLGIATLPSVSSSILVPTLIFPYPCRFSGGLLSTPFLARTLSDAASDTACLAKRPGSRHGQILLAGRQHKVKVKIVLSPRYDAFYKEQTGFGAIKLGSKSFHRRIYLCMQFLRR